MLKVLLDPVKDVFKLVKYEEVLETHYSDTMPFEIHATEQVVGLGKFVAVSLAVELDRERFLDTEEIEHIGTNAVLPPELSTFELRVLQCIPQGGFRRSRSPPKLLSLFFLLRLTVQPRSSSLHSYKYINVPRK